MFDANATLAGGTSTDRRVLFEREALPHLDAVYSAAMRLTRNQDRADDLVQETMLRALRFFHLFEAGTNCRAWLLTILYNNFRNLWRRNGREPVLPSIQDFEVELETHRFGAESWNSSPEKILSARNMGGVIEAALEALPKDFRKALLLVDAQELNYAEAARTLSLPIGTIKSRVSRGRAMMRHALSKLARVEGLDAKRYKLRFAAARLSTRSGQIDQSARGNQN
jgi:RNA polymerase sigma-70 factor, ECF subfamily